MIFTELGRTGMKVSCVWLGTWQFGSGSWGFGKTYSEKNCVEAVLASVEEGVNFIDTAEVYGNGLSEQIIGKALKELKDEVFIATKVAPHHLTYDGVMKACERSLRRLGIKTIDLYQIHFPNPLIPLSRTMKAMEDLVKLGKIRYIGVSNFSLKLLKKARELMKREEIVSNQVRYNLLEREIEKDLMPYCMKEKISVLAYSPLAQGILTGKFSTSNRPSDIIRRINRLYTAAYIKKSEPLFSELRGIAQRKGVSIGQVAIAWVTGHEMTVAIVGAKNRQQAVENAKAGELTLDTSEMNRLSELSDTVKPTTIDAIKAIPRIFGLG